MGIRNDAMTQAWTRDQWLITPHGDSEHLGGTLQDGYDKLITPHGDSELL